MTAIRYPGPWLDDLSVGGFPVRYPWVEAFDRAAGGPVAVLVPPAAGPVDDWAGWVRDRLAVSHLRVPAAGGTPDGLADALAGAFDDPREGGEFRWDRFLARQRADQPHVQPTPLVVAGPDADSAAALVGLLAAQRQLGYPLLAPTVVADAPLPRWPEAVVWFGPPEPTGDLHRILPLPHDDPPHWTRLVLALTACWEGGGLPPLTDLLWEEMTAGRHPSLTDAGFDQWLDRMVVRFAATRRWPALGLSADLAFAPADEAPQGAWQAGAVVRVGGRYDLTPAFARRWADGQSLPQPARSALSRRVLTNGPFVRWLAAWAASAEETLRVAVLRRGGEAELAAYLRRAQARDRRLSGSRWDELKLTTTADLVTEVELIDLCDFFAAGRGTTARDLFDQLRKARNRVVHERRWSAADLLAITRVDAVLASERIA